MPQQGVCGRELFRVIHESGIPSPFWFMVRVENVSFTLRPRCPAARQPRASMPGCHTATGSILPNKTPRPSTYRASIAWCDSKLASGSCEFLFTGNNAYGKYGTAVFFLKSSQH